MWSGSNVESVKRVWATELGKVSPEQIAMAMDACKRRRFPPTLPEFLELCRPTAESLGIPPMPVAYREAIDLACARKRQSDVSHPVVWHAYCEAGNLGHMADDKGYDRFKHCYQVAVDMAIKGEPLREIPKALPKPEDVTPPQSPEERKAAADAAMARLREMGFDIRGIGRQGATP